jgi:3-isopropylmalate dehydrogenase
MSEASGTYRVLLLPGDGIGTEVVGAAREVLDEAANRFGFSIEYEERLAGAAAIRSEGAPISDETLQAARDSDAVLLGAVGHPDYDGGSVRPEAGLLKLRGALEVFANLRPVASNPALTPYSPLKPEVVEGVDLLIVRELTGGMYFGDKEEAGEDGDRASDSVVYTSAEIERVARVAFEAARGRGGRLASVDKANVVATSRLWRRVVNELSAEYPDVELEHVLVDAAAMYLVQNPGRFDVIVTENLFGDILSDEAAMLPGSMGMLPSASLGAPGNPGLYEPVHGSAPDIAGQGVANPYAAILSAALLLRHSLDQPEAATAIEEAVHAATENGTLTRDLGGESGTEEATRAVLEHMSNTNNTQQGQKEAR